MNQILSTEMKKNKKGSKKSSGPADIKTVVRVFCILLILFGLVLVGQGSYAMYQSMSAGTATQNKEGLPTVDITRDGNDVVIKASHDKEIKKLVYQWNAGEEKTINGDGSNYLEYRMELPIGNNTLNIKVVDVAEKEITYQKEYVTDATKPQIGIERTDNANKLKIIAKDNTALSYITYRWDDGEETKIEPKEETKAQIEQEIEIPKGEHNLTVIAVNSNNVTETKTQTIKGVTKPKIGIVQDGKYLVITATDDNAMKQIDYTLNGKPYRIDYSTVKEKTIEYRQEMAPGENRISLKATNSDGVEETFEGICNYNP